MREEKTDYLIILKKALKMRKINLSILKLAPVIILKEFIKIKKEIVLLEEELQKVKESDKVTVYENHGGLTLIYGQQMPKKT